MTQRLLSAALATLAMGVICTDALAYPHVVQPGETLAQIATKAYGDASNEIVLAAANFLDVLGGSTIRPGMRLEIPSLSYHRVVRGETWYSMSALLLGDSKRADTLARANKAQSWVPPTEGEEIAVPYNLTILCTDGETVFKLADRFYRNNNRAWEIDSYNGWTEAPSLKRGDIVLLPLLDLTLTEEAKREAGGTTEGETTAAAQKRAHEEMPLLLAEVHNGKYVESIARGNRLLGAGMLAPVQRQMIHEALTESYVAVDAWPLAKNACAVWRSLDPAFRLDPVTVSPKIRRACEVP